VPELRIARKTRGSFYRRVDLIATTRSDHSYPKEIFMRLRNLGLATGLISCCVCLTAYAQTTDKSFTTTSEDCAGVHWSPETLAKYPNIVPACQSVETHNGKHFVKFSATVVKNLNQGKQLTLNLKDGGEVTVDVPANTRLMIDGKETPMSRVRRGDKLSFYVPESRVVPQFAAEPELPPQKEPEYTARFIPAPPPAPERVASTLPKTGSDVPLFAVSGLLMLALGASLTAARLFKRG
jgi:LPXTG-motif cell wall-anchored protein